MLIFQHTALVMNEWMVCPRLLPLQARMRIHQQKQTLVEPCLFYMLFITNNIADALSDLSWTVVLARMWRTVRFVFFPNYWLLFPTITVIINKPSPVIENMLISQMRCCRTQLEQKPIGHQTPEVMIWAPMFQVINGALESIIAGSSCEWLIWHCVVLFSQLEMKLGDTLIHA